MRERKTYLKMLDELGGLGFVHYEEYEIIKKRINSKYNGLGKR